MPALSSFDYAIVRVVPHVEREEFINAGAIVYCLQRDFLAARVYLDQSRLLILAPDVDADVVQEHLEAIPRICRGGENAGPIGQLPTKERWHWLVSPRSTQVQRGPVHSGLCADPTRALDELLKKMVCPSRP